MKRLLESLQHASGEGTTLITMLLPSGFQLHRAASKLAEELGTCTHIKKPATRGLVKEAITSAQSKLKLYKNTPPYGLAVFAGTVCEGGKGGKERHISVAFEPLKPTKKFIYHCDKSFHVVQLQEALQDQQAFGFIVLMGDGCLFATLAGTTKKILQKISVELPNKHGRGGQSAPRFQRLRLEKRAAYVKKVSELATAHFLAEDEGRARVSGLVLAGAAEMKEELLASHKLHPKVNALLLRTVAVSAGGEAGLAQAIELSADALGGVKLVAEQRLLRAFEDELARGGERCCYGVTETLAALEEGAVDTLIVHDGLQDQHPRLGGLLAEWLADHHHEFGSALQLVSTATEAGARFAGGMGGVGGLLRYAWEATEDEVAPHDEAVTPAAATPVGDPPQELDEGEEPEDQMPPAAGTSATPSTPTPAKDPTPMAMLLKSNLNPNAAVFVPRGGA